MIVTATFVLSLDLEMAWGSWRGVPFERDAFAAEPEVARRLDAVAVELRTPFTWAVVGAIEGLCESDLAEFDQESPVNAAFGDSWRAPEIPTVGLVRQDPSAWLSPGLIPELAASSARHEIASHTFFHGLPPTRREMTIDLDRHSKAVAGMGATTLVFPGDRIDPTVVAGTAISCYRGLVNRPWFRPHGRPRGFGKVIHLLEQGLGISAPLATVQCGNPIVLGSSAILTLRYGMRRKLPTALMRRRLRASIDRAIASNGIFHLWTHPWNLALHGSDAFDLLAEALQVVASRRDLGDIEVLTMADVARRACSTP